MQVRAQVSSHFVTPASSGNGQLDLTVVSALFDFRRLRQDVPWAVASAQSYGDDGSPLPVPMYEPIDPTVAPGEAPLMREFCSDPPPTLRIAPGERGVTRYEIIEGPVGKTAALTCVTGWMSRGTVTAWRTEHDRYGEHSASLTTPAELIILDLFVHRDAGLRMPPTPHLYSLLPGGPVYPSCGHDRGQLPLREPLIHLGACPPDLVTPEVRRYRQLVQAVADRLKCTLKDF